MRILILFFCVGLKTISGQECWWSGCQPFNWAVRGCPDGYTQTGAADCAGGTIYNCCLGSPSIPDPVIPDPGNGGDEGQITQAQFNAAAFTKFGNPSLAYYQGFLNSLPKAGITTKREAVLFLAHTVWETVGFIYTKEVYCQTNLQDCLNAYPNNAGGLPGRVYYGRGMLQLTWDYNYKAASLSLYGDDRLIQNPDQVGEVPQLGWDTAAWYWRINVHPNAATFGSTLKSINGFLECEGGSHGQNRVIRFNHYKDILRILSLPMPPDSDGWCTSW